VNVVYYSVINNYESLFNIIFITPPLPSFILSIFVNVQPSIFNYPDDVLFINDPYSRIIFMNEHLFIVDDAIFI
jgi:hypothetical protein